MARAYKQFTVDPRGFMDTRVASKHRKSIGGGNRMNPKEGAQFIETKTHAIRPLRERNNRPSCPKHKTSAPEFLNGPKLERIEID